MGQPGPQGDVFCVVFSCATQALAAAVQIQRTLAAEPWPPGGVVRVRIGMHTGEVEPEGESPIGITVYIGARVMQMASPGEVLVSSTVKDLVAGSGITFTDRGTHTLKGFPGEWRLFSPDVREASGPT